MHARTKSSVDDANQLSQPIFKDIFGPNWDELPLVLRSHYANRPFSNDRTVVSGVLNIRCRSFMRLARPFYRIIGGIPTVNETNVPVTVDFESSPQSQAFHFNRIFHFFGKTPYRFRSRMEQINANEVVEVMPFGFCWKTAYGWDGEKVTLRHRGYALRLKGRHLPLPISWLLGRGNANEVAVDDEHFDMEVSVTHPLFGVVYSYAGRFKLIDKA